MWFYNFALKYFDESEGKTFCACGIAAGKGIQDIVDRLCKMYGDFWDFHIDFCGEDQDGVLTMESIADFAEWREKYADYTEAQAVSAQN